ncbi:MAG: VOC family protein [Thermoplasmata archaeon]|nr:VOC family protein [Thermoplasmata archaeon]
MPDSWLSDIGIRVTNLERSLAFYRRILDLVELARRADEDSAYVLLKDPRSGQRLELNWYAETNPFYAPYVGGEGLDHIEVRVRNLPEMLERLRTGGIVPVNRTMWVNRPVVEKLRADPKMAAMMESEVWTTSTGHRIAYVADPDGNLVCLYDHPEESWDGPIPEHY